MDKVEIDGDTADGIVRASLKDSITCLRESSDEHAKGYIQTRKRIAAMESEIDRLHARNAVLESATARADRVLIGVRIGGAT